MNIGPLLPKLSTKIKFCC